MTPSPSALRAASEVVHGWDYERSDKAWLRGHAIDVLITAVAALLDAAVAEEREANCAMIREKCMACLGSGEYVQRPLGPVECEYCGRTIDAIRARAAK